MVYIEPGRTEESEDEIGPAAASKAAIDSGAELADPGGLSMAQVLLDMAMAPLLGIQIWGVGRKPVPLDPGMHTQILSRRRSPR